MKRNLALGIIDAILESIAPETKSSQQFVLSFDGKLIRSGLTNESGEVDMAGIENSPTDSERRYRLEKETETVDDLLLNLSLFHERDTVASLENQMKENMLQKLQTVSKLLTVRLKEIRELKRAKTYNIKSMIECVGREAKWRKSKMVNAIS